MASLSILSALAWVLTLSVVVYGFVDDILNALEKAVDCPTCHEILVVLVPLAFLGDSAFSNTLITICKVAEVQDFDVCEGIISQQGPIIAHDLRRAGPFGKAATRLCNSLTGLCQQPPVTPYSLQFAKPRPTAPKVCRLRARRLSRLSISVMYTSTEVMWLDQNLTARNLSVAGTIQTTLVRFRSLQGQSDTNANVACLLHVTSGERTEYQILDLYWRRCRGCRMACRQTGSIVGCSNNKELATLLNSPVYPVIGNHEVAPINSFPRNTSTGVLNSQWVFDIESTGWAPWIGPAAASSVQHMSGNYATVVPGTSLKILSLNTMYWYRNNFYLSDDNSPTHDPNGVLAFAAQELQAAEDAGQRVWIVAHMSPGSVDALFDQSNYFDQIIQRYNNTIAAQFYGHSHEDEFEIAYSNYSNQNSYTATSVAYLAPSLTPRSANPAFRVYDVDPDTYEIMDSRTFIADMTGTSFQISPAWKLEYSARDSYGAAIGGWPSSQSLTPAFWHKVTEVFTSNDTLFQQFVSFRTRGVAVVPCTADCKTNTICGLRALRAENGCHTATFGLNFRRGVAAVISPQSDRCEAIGLPQVISMIAEKVRTFGADTFK